MTHQIRPRVSRAPRRLSAAFPICHGVTFSRSSSCKGTHTPAYSNAVVNYKGGTLPLCSTVDYKRGTAGEQSRHPPKIKRQINSRWLENAVAAGYSCCRLCTWGFILFLDTLSTPFCPLR